MTKKPLCTHDTRLYLRFYKTKEFKTPPQQQRIGADQQVIRPCFCFDYRVIRFLFAGLDIVFVLFDHLLDHLTAYGTCLTRGKITVVTVCKIYAHLTGGLHLKLIKRSLGFGNKSLIVGHFNLLVCTLAYADAHDLY